MYDKIFDYLWDHKIAHIVASFILCGFFGTLVFLSLITGTIGMIIFIIIAFFTGIFIVIDFISWINIIKEDIKKRKKEKEWLNFNNNPVKVEEKEKSSKIEQPKSEPIKKEEKNDSKSQNNSDEGKINSNSEQNEETIFLKSVGLDDIAKQAEKIKENEKVFIKDNDKPFLKDNESVDQLRNSFRHIILDAIDRDGERLKNDIASLYPNKELPSVDEIALICKALPAAERTKLAGKLFFYGISFEKNMEIAELFFRLSFSFKEDGELAYLIAVYNLFITKDDSKIKLGFSYLIKGALMNDEPCIQLLNKFIN